ncbi:MAG: helix-turn-helix transcriptional regulator [Ignavibacteriales bacterium]|nr:helix-turn-helix transcriptional regulator [Ignavibacteriales bacterium]
MNQEKQDILYKHISLKIKELRSQIKLTQSELAKRLGLSRTSIVNIEQNRHKPTLHLLYEISLIGKVEIGYFFKDIELNEGQSTVSKKTEKEISKKVQKEDEQEIIKSFISFVGSKKA